MLTESKANAVPKATKFSVVVQVLALVAVGGLVAGYVHAELYTVYGPFTKLRDWTPAPDWAVYVRRIRWFIRGLAAVSLATLMVLEIRWRAVTEMLARIVDRRVILTIALIAAGALSGMYFLLPGYLTAALDGYTYTQLGWLIREALDAHELPIWSNWGDMGFPLMQFYSPLFFATVALVNYAIPNIWIAAKLVLFGIHVLSILAMYAFVRQLTASRYAGVAAAVVFGLLYYRYHSLVYLNKFVMAPTFVIWPMQLYLVDRVVTARRTTKAIIGLAAVTAIGMLAHAHFGGHGALFSGIYGLIRTMTLEADNARTKVLTLVRLVVGFGLGILASLSYTLPAILESDLTVVSTFYETGYFPTTTAFERDTLEAVFTFKGSQAGPKWQYGYVGNALLVFAAIGYSAALARKKWQALGLALLLLLTLLLALGPVWILFVHQGSYLAFVVILATIGAGMCVAELEYGSLRGVVKTLARTIFPMKPVPIPPLWLLIAVVLPVAFDMLPRTLSLNYLTPPSDNGSPPNRTAAHRYLAKHNSEYDGRVLDPTQQEYNLQIPMVTGLAGFENNGTSSIYSAIFMRNLRPDPLNPWGVTNYSPQELFGKAYNLLLLANTDWVITDDTSLLNDVPDALRTEDGAVLLPTGGGLPLVASQEVRVTPMPKQMASLANHIGLDRERGAARYLPVLDEQPPLASNVTDQSHLSVQILEHSVESQHVRLRYTLSVPAYVQASYAYYPYLRVQIDGEDVASFPTSFGLIGFLSPEGTHALEIVPYLSPLRVATGVINISVVVLLILSLGISMLLSTKNHWSNSR